MYVCIMSVGGDGPPIHPFPTPPQQDCCLPTDEASGPPHTRRASWQPPNASAIAMGEEEEGAAAGGAGDSSSSYRPLSAPLIEKKGATAASSFDLTRAATAAGAAPASSFDLRPERVKLACRVLDSYPPASYHAVGNAAGGGSGGGRQGGEWVCECVGGVTII